MRIRERLLLMLMSCVLACQAVHGKTIFDDDWTPPASSQPLAQPPGQTQPSQQPAQNAPPGTDLEKSGVGTTAPNAQIAMPAVLRRPIPPAADQGKSRKLFKQFYAKDLVDRSVAGRRALVGKLLKQASAVSDAPSDEFVLLVGATQAARETNEIALLCKAADALTAAFAVDGLRVKADAISQMSFKKDASTEAEENLSEGMKVVDELSAVEDFSNALKLVKQLQSAAPDADVRSQLLESAQKIEALQAAANRLALFSRLLKTSPDDPVASLAVGEHLCFDKGDWAHGLPLLAKVKDKTIKALAVQELKNPTDAEQQFTLAESWWAFAATLQGPQVTATQLHAQQWYRTALQGLTELHKIKAEVRLADTPRAPVANDQKAKPIVRKNGMQPGLVAELFQDMNFGRVVKTRIDRQIYFDWQKQGPEPSMAGQRFSIRWTGSLRIPKTSTYALFAAVDNEIEIWIDGRQVLSQRDPTDDAKGEFAATAGLHPIQIAYKNTGGPGYLMLQWEQMGGFKRQCLDRNALCHDPAAGAGAKPAEPVWRSEMIRTRNGAVPFVEAAPPHTVLVGFELTMYKPRSFIVIKSVRAIYRGPHGEIPDAQHGSPEGPVERIVAQPGYAVGFVHADSGLRIDQISLRFMRLVGDTLDPTTTYESPKYGGDGGGRNTDAGEGKPIIGIYGAADNVECFSLGVITAD